jgi:hypothetical protein
MVEDQAILEEADGHQAADDSSKAGGAETMLQEALVNEFAQDGNFGEDGRVHFSFSN